MSQQHLDKIWLEKSKETTEIFKVSLQTLWRWRQDPTFPEVLQYGKTILYDINAIFDWLKQQSKNQVIN